MYLTSKLVFYIESNGCSLTTPKGKMGTYNIQIDCPLGLPKSSTMQLVL